MISNEERIQQIRKHLENHLSPTQLEIIDDSHMHAGHGAQGGHFTVNITSDAFQGKSLVQRHRLVYDALNDMLQSEIHALSIQAKTPAENQ